MKKVIIMQGIPGSGKSFAVSKLANPAVCSADFFFEKDGHYDFDVKKLPEAHAACLLAFLGFVQEGKPLVVVDNTSTTVAEVAPYYALAQAHGYEVEIHTVKADPKVAAARNTHGVPLAACEAMAKRIEKFAAAAPPWWVIKSAA